MQAAEGEFDPRLARYGPQMRFAPFGVEGQKRLRHSSVVVIGCGALGSVTATLLVRAGVGVLRVIDRDYVEVENLHRQSLFDERDVVENLPKAEAATRRLRRMNSATEVSGVIADVHAGNLLALIENADLVLDGTDNLETRYLINDAAVQLGLPWIYGACVGAEGRVLPILPGRSACLRCIWDDPPAPGALPTCDTAGVLAPAAFVVGSLQAVAAMKILTGQEDTLDRRLVTVDVWSGRWQGVDVQAAFERRECPCCAQGRYEFLQRRRVSETIELCGRDAVQITPAGEQQADLRRIANRLGSGQRPVYNEFLLRFAVEGRQVTVFRDGRAIVKGTADPAIARKIYARYIGM